MKFISKSENDTINLGIIVGSLLLNDSTVTLIGDLAGGKTTFTKGIGLGLNIKEVINSPTFTILKSYHGDKILHHIDAYRLANSTYDLGFEDLEPGIMVIEWPAYYQEYLPKEYLEINFVYLNDNTREITIKAHGLTYQELLKEIENAYAMH